MTMSSSYHPFLAVFMSVQFNLLVSARNNAFSPSLVHTFVLSVDKGASRKSLVPSWEPVCSLGLLLLMA